MASETVVSDHSTACEEVEKEVKSEVKKMEPEKVYPPKESVENPKVEELACPTVPSAESEARIEEKKIETPVIEEVKEIGTNEKPIAEASAEMASPHLTESIEQEIEGKPVEFPPTEEKKIEDAPIAEARDIPENTKENFPEPETASISEPIVETIECKSEEKTETEHASKQEESKLESVEEKLDELPKKIDLPEPSSVEENMEELPAKEEVVAIELKDVKVLEAGCKANEITESTPLVEEKPLEQSEVTEQTAKEPTVVEPVKDVEVETPVDKVEDSKLAKEVKPANEETIAIESSDQVKSDTPEIKVQEKDVECYPSDEVSEMTGETTEKKEPSKKTVEVEGLLEEKIVEPGKIEAKTEEKSVVDYESAKCEGKPIDDATSSVPPPEVSEKATEEEVTFKDIELVTENGKKDETVASAETTKDAEVYEKVEKEAAKTETEEKIEEKAQATETKLEEEKQVVDAAKTDVQNPESTKDCEETKTSPDAPKEDVPVKTQKQSNNFIKMMKHSLVKAKKAIIGKSQNSKSPADSEPKDDVNK